MINLNCLMDHILYQMIFKIILNRFKKKHGESVDKPSVQIYVKKIENGYTLELLTPETKKLLGSKDKRQKW